VPSTPDKPPKKTTTKAKESTKGRAPRQRRVPTQEAIAKRAYELYLVQGGGDPVSHWLEAERDLSAS
jgi:hypothetical protein